MSAPAVVFKSRQPEVIAAYLAEREVKEEVFQSATQAFEEKVGGRKLFGTRFFDGGFSVFGYNMESYNEDLPEGWRRDGRTMRAVPAKRTPEGKEIAKELGKLRLAGNHYPGAPRELHTESVDGQGFMLFPRVEQVGDEYFLTVSMEPKASEMERLDPEHWEQAKLSTYFLAVEEAAPATV